jgi:hypothetical protein
MSAASLVPWRSRVARANLGKEKTHDSTPINLHTNLDLIETGRVVIWREFVDSGSIREAYES